MPRSAARRPPALRTFAMALAAALLVATFPVGALAGGPPAWPVTVRDKAHPYAGGGMGAVYRGSDAGHRTFAVKFNRNDANTHTEGQTLAAINGHPGWPQFHGTHNFGGAFANRPGNVVDWVPGQALKGFVPKNQGQAVRIVQQLLGHLEELHALGWVHGDVKPANVIIDPARGSASVTLVDFGIARRQGVVGTQGTAEYKAPEQWRGGAWTPATDTYGAAGVLVHLLTRRDPFPAARALFNRGIAASSPELVQVHEARAILGSVRDPGLRQVLTKALDPNPAQRYQSAAELRAALAPFAR